MADELMKRGYKLITNGTDNHLMVMSCIDKGLTGSKLETALDACHITLNKNTIVGDKSAVTPDRAVSESVPLPSRLVATLRRMLARSLNSSTRSCRPH